MGVAYQLQVFRLEAVNLHPIGVASWVGMFATALNLLTKRQLDGATSSMRYGRRYIAISHGGLWGFWSTWAGTTWDGGFGHFWLLHEHHYMRQRQAPDFPIFGSRYGLALVGLALLVTSPYLVHLLVHLNWRKPGENTSLVAVSVSVAAVSSTNLEVISAAGSPPTIP